MLDTARTFHPIPTLQKLIDGLSSTKLNVLHLHLTDGDRFPVEIPGLYTPERPFYTQKELQDLKTYAFERGIQLVPEIDSPSHTYAWSEIQDVNACDSESHQIQWEKYCPTPPCGQLDLSQQATFDLIKKIVQFQEETFGASGYIHVGGDEVGELCYTESESMKRWMAAQQLASVKEVEAFYREAIASEVKGTPIFWGYDLESLYQEYPKDAVIQIWAK